LDFKQRQKKKIKIFVCDDKEDYGQDYSVRSFGKVWRWRGDDSETLQLICGPAIARSRLILIRVNMKERTLLRVPELRWRYLWSVSYELAMIVAFVDTIGGFDCYGQPSPQPSRVIAPRIVERRLLETVDTTPRPSVIVGIAYLVGKDPEKCV